MLGPLGLLAHKLKVVDHLRLVKRAALRLALLVASNHHPEAESLLVNRSVHDYLT